MASSPIVIIFVETGPHDREKRGVKRLLLLREGVHVARIGPHKNCFTQYRKTIVILCFYNFFSESINSVAGLMCFSLCSGVGAAIRCLGSDEKTMTHISYMLVACRVSVIQSLHT
jgi:hypothetical protein